MILKIKAKLTSVENGYFHGIVLEEKDLPRAGEVIHLQWRSDKSVRKLNQNGLYWLFMTFCVGFLKENDPTMTPVELHESLKGTLLPKKVLTIPTKAWEPSFENINGEIVESMVEKDTSITLLANGSTRKMSVSDFAEYFNKAIEFMGSLGVPVELFKAEYKDYCEKFLGKEVL